MTFERIKKVGKYYYRYEVRSVRVDGKVKQKIVENLGRVDKPSANIPYGFFYLSEEYYRYPFYDSKKEVEEECKILCEIIKQEVGMDIPQIQYVDLKIEKKKPLPISLFSIRPPALSYCGKKGVYVKEEKTDLEGKPTELWLNWLNWLFGNQVGSVIYQKFLLKKSGKTVCIV